MLMRPSMMSAKKETGKQLSCIVEPPEIVCIVRSIA
jgi:hypothetical protein